MRLLFAVIAVLALVLLFCEGGNAWWLWVRRRAPSPVHCSVSAWTSWNGCSKSCGGGQSVRTRKITRNKAHGGNACPALRQTKSCNTHKCPVPCLFSGWASWGTCSKTCGAGQTIRTRTITRHPAHGGSSCPTLRESKACNIRACPVPCLVSGWASWGTCSKTCGAGQTIRTRAITRHPAHGGSSCPTLRESKACNIRTCPVPCLVSGWASWGTCSKTCGAGQTIRTRTITRHPAHGGSSCPTLRESKACNIRTCPVPCLVSGWASWGTCSKTCGAGQTIRTRTITRHPAHGGSSCPTLRESKACNIRACPVPCLVSGWASWGTCSKTCGAGQTIRTRTITRHPAHGGSSCPTLRESKACNIRTCPVACLVSIWAGWETCSKTCGEGETIRTRNITRPSAHGGTSCPALRQTKVCNIRKCPVPCQVSDWEHWSACSETCGVGVAIRSRNITRHPAHGAPSCPALQQNKTCNLRTCPVPCLISDWTGWGMCSKTCGAGEFIRTRNITRNAAHGAPSCPALQQTQVCNIRKCPVPCIVSDWNDWSACSKSCGEGESIRSRNITRHPAHGAPSCPVLHESNSCHIRPCPVPCEVSGWTAWDACSKTCGEGVSNRTRNITNHPAHGGRSCPDLQQTKVCHIRKCPVPCLVSDWERWSTCSRHCGGGHSIKTRNIIRYPLYGGLGCPALSQIKTCNTQACPMTCSVSEWAHWSICSKTCDGGQLIRTRNITVHPGHGVASCPALQQTQTCNSQECPVPVTCKWSAWSAWSSCDPCFPGGRSQSRNVTIPAMFNGMQCLGSRDNLDYSCTSGRVCIKEKCPSRKFSCKNGLGCIFKYLQCNGDDDCPDNSDEQGCSNIRLPCGSRLFKKIPDVNITGSGFDITKLREEGRILDNERYNGRCLTVRGFRIPANMLSYWFNFRVNPSFIVKSYESSMNYFQDERSSFKRKLGSSSSRTSNLSAKSSGSNSIKTRMVIDFGTDSDSKFFKISNTIEVARFSMFGQKFLLSFEFQQRLDQLPNNFDYSKYSQVISDFGTHFYYRGVLGGKYEYVYRYSKKALNQSGLSDNEQKSCLSWEAGFSFFGFGGGGGRSKCSSNQLSQRHKGSFTRSAANAASNVVGGTSDKAAALSFFSGKTPNKSDYDEWVKTVKHNPAVIDYTLSPISSAVPLSSYKKRKNMDRALVLYLKEYDSSKCKGKCANGAGVVVVKSGKLCKCLCPANYGGINCSVRV
ncbi:thrombospondin type-1 domain-containing protein 7A isoform X1 [Ciona intestinalis]